MASWGNDNKPMFCSFCKKSNRDVKKLIAGPDVKICDECVLICIEVLTEDGLLTQSLERAPDSAPAQDIKITVPSPRRIFDELNKLVFGQPTALKLVAISVFRHYTKVSNPGLSAFEDKDNLLLIGPTGSGKTLIAKALAEYLKVPLAIVDATALTEAGYVGEDVDSVLRLLLREAGGNQHLAEKGIVFIDEIDKLARTTSQNRSITRDVSGEGVQQALLTMLAGGVIDADMSGSRKNPDTPRRTWNTRDILFIGAGSFEGIKQIVDARRRALPGSEPATPFAPASTETSSCTQLDLELFGFMPEFAGRFTSITEMRQLDGEDYERILRNSPKSVLQEYATLFQTLGARLVVEDDAYPVLASAVAQERAGARGLRRAVERVLMEVLYVLPDKPTIRKCVITADAARGIVPPLVVDECGAEVKLRRNKVFLSPDPPMRFRCSGGRSS